MVKVNNVQQSIDTIEREELFTARRAHGHEEAFALNRQLWTECPENQKVTPYPLHVDIELSSVCNLHCPMCYTNTDNFKTTVDTGFMELELFKKIADECAAGGVYSIRLSLRGEALLHKNLIECIEYAKKIGISEVSTLSNGKKLIDRDFCKRLIAAGLDWITISIDGVDDVYESIRKPIRFEEIKTAMNNLMACRDELNAQKPAIKIQGVWPAIKPQVDKYIDIFTPLSDLLYTNPLVDYLFKDNAEGIEYLPDFTCYQPFQRLVIGSDGKALLCANDQTGEVIIGDAHKMTVFELWHGSEMKQFRESHIRHEALRDYPQCKKCQVPRKREYEEATVKGRCVFIENYSQRSQVVGE